MKANAPDDGPPDQPPEVPLIPYARIKGMPCAGMDWVISSQRAADFYDSGVKLWRKEDLLDIEQQLAQSLSLDKFTIRRIDGSIIYLENPMFGVKKPIWKPVVQFQEYWQLVRNKPDGPPETWLCSYLVNWETRAVKNYWGTFENGKRLFEVNQARWKSSVTYQELTSDFRALLQKGKKKIDNIVCFALGEITEKPHDTNRSYDKKQPRSKRSLETDHLESSLTQHAIALTLAEVAQSCAEAEGQGTPKVRLLAQDPVYNAESKELLRSLGFGVVGEHGAGGFAELTRQSFVYTAFPCAPISQIVADITQPAMIICNDMDGLVLNSHDEPYANPDSPRTRQMLEGYETQSFPNPSDIVELPGQPYRFVICSRRDQEGA